MFALLLGLFAFPADTPSDEAKAAALVMQLGDPSYRKREMASRDLIALGPVSRSAVEEGLKSANAEIRERCGKLLPAIWDASFAARIAGLKADPEYRLPHDLPGWNRFARRADAAGRARYARVLVGQAEAVKSLECEPSKFAEHFEGRIAEANGLEPEVVAQLRRGDFQLPLAFDADETAFWFLILSEPRAMRALAEPKGTRQAFVKLLLRTADSQRYWTAANRAFLTAALEAALESCLASEADSELLAAGFALAQKRDLAGMADIAAGWLARKHPGRKLVDESIGLLGMFGRLENLKSLGELLADDTVLAKDYFKDYTTQTRDFALAMSLRIERQSPRDFGFAMDSRQAVPRAYSYGFKSEGDRAKAFEMYAEFLRK